MATSRSQRADQILQAALRLFAEKGLHESSMDELVVESGLSKGSLYWHFESKDEIVLAVLARLFDGELYHLEALVEAKDSAVDRLRALALLTVEELGSQESVLPILLEFYALAARRPQARQVIAEYLQRYRDLLNQIIVQGQERGELRAGDSQAAATAILAAFEGLMMHWALDPVSLDLDAEVAAVMELFLRGLASHSGA